ncbi:ABC transporter substrate-binding protein [Paenibacillus flagellatus]|uniref:ABC transporter substrate-binding protein n=1 Tax=Paenibacillus flagellatus TaxID=2211139 RepID=A0A2V5KHR0_9BACL|nr:ABC transporter substrate-binding protein [Paenibacillus flagellatus]PYI53880.1 ABC transporter substrate-binding protein [Paenibacillus flagellatus]
MKKLATRAVSLAVTSALAVSLAACGSSKDDAAGSGGDKAKEPVTLTLLSHYAGPQEEKLKPYVDMWNKDHPDIQVKLEPVDFGELLKTIQAKQTAGQVADIMHVYSLWGGQLTKSKVLAEPPADVLDDVKKNYPEASVKGASIGGKVYGFPTEVNAYALFYNKKMLKDAGFDNPPKTWDEMYNMAKAITKKDASGKIVQQGFGFARGYASIVDQPFMALMATAGGQLISDDLKKAQLDSDAGKKTMEYAAKFYKDGIADVSFSVSKTFGAEQTAMTIQAGWWAGSLQGTMKDAYKNIGAAPLPSPDGTKKGSVAYTWMWGVNNKSKHQKEAWEFLKWFNTVSIKDGLTPEGSFLLDAFNSLSTRKSDLDAKPIKDKLASDEVLKTFVDALNYAQPEPNPAAGTEIQDILFKQIESTWTGQTTPEAAVQAAQKEIQSKLGAE